MDREIFPAPTVRALFAGLGPSQFAIDDPPQNELIISHDRARVRREIRQQCPAAPGVYGMLDRQERLIYVGRSSCLRDRLLTYFYDSTKVDKQRQVAGICRRIVWERAGHELLATLRELELIRRWRPRLNIQGQPGRTRSGYIFLTPVKASHFRVERLPTRDCRRSWGPVPLNYRTRAAVERLNHFFRLRDCPQRTPMRFADQGQLFGGDWPAACYRGEIDTCLAPCTGRCSHQDYAREVTAACQLLDGTDASVLNDLTLAIDVATSEQKLDQLVSLGATWDELLYLCEQTQFARDVRRDYQFVLPVTDHGDRQVWLLIDNARVAAIVAAPDTAHGADRCRQQLDETYNHTGLVQTDDFEMIRLLVSWFRNHPEEQAHIQSPATALDHCHRLATSRAAA